jgi:cyanophycin synthetase
VHQAAISVIPDEQDAVEAALRMGRAGDLLLVFADALTRSWKQITKFKPVVVPAQTPAAPASSAVPPEAGAPPQPDALMEIDLDGLIHDERGVRLAPEGED